MSFEDLYYLLRPRKEAASVLQQKEYNGTYRALAGIKNMKAV